MDQCQATIPTGHTVALVRSTGKALQERLSSVPMNVRRKENNHQNLVTDFDVWVQNTLKTGLAEIAPEAAFFAEEKENQEMRGLTWIVDPIDGTTNFISTRRDFAICVALYDGAWVKDPYVIAQNDNQISINTSLEVDLTGQCASESIGSRQFSGTGGQSDTAVGAQMSKGGRSIIALYSTAMVKDKATGERHEVSKIVAQLQRGAAVSLSRNDVDIVITEYGAADLRGANIRQRVEALISIAHPEFRGELWDQALACGIIGKR